MLSRLKRIWYIPLVESVADKLRVALDEDIYAALELMVTLPTGGVVSRVMESL